MHRTENSRQTAAKFLALAANREPPEFEPVRPRYRSSKTKKNRAFIWLRAAIIKSVWKFPKMPVDIFRELEVGDDDAAQRAAWRHLARCRRVGFIARTDEGYIATPRGRAAIQAFFIILGGAYDRP